MPNLITKGGILKFCFLIAVSLALFCSEFDSSITPENENPTSNNTRYHDQIGQQIVCGTPLETTLWAGQHIDVGTVNILNTDDGFLHVFAFLTGDWYAIESQLHLANDPSEFPMTPKGNPKIGNFDYKLEYDPPTQMVHYEFLLDSLGFEEGDIFYTALHITVQRIVNDQGIQTETAWPEGPEFPGNSWAMYMMYEVQECEPPDDSTDIDTLKFRTQTQGGWGTVAHGNNPGVYRDANFSLAFPQGLVIGRTSGRYAQFNSSLAIQNFLPQGGTPNYLFGTYINPFTTSAGVLGGQVTALTLSVVFDEYDPDFGEAPELLKNLKVADETNPFYNMTVMDVLNYANDFLSTGTGPFSATEINMTVSKINENFVDGTHDNGFLKL